MSEQLYMPRMCGCGCENAIPTNDPFGPQEYRFDDSWPVWQAGRRWLQKWTWQKKEERREDAKRGLYVPKDKILSNVEDIRTCGNTGNTLAKNELGNPSQSATFANLQESPRPALDAYEKGTIPFPRLPPTGDALIDTFEELERRLGHADPRVDSALVEALQMLGIAMMV